MSKDMGNLVLLRYADNPLCVSVTEAHEQLPEHFSYEVDLEKGVWRFARRGSSSSKQVVERPIGKAFIESTDWLRSSKMPIGVFDRSQLEHLNSLASAASSAVQSNLGGYDSL